MHTISRNYLGKKYGTPALPYTVQISTKNDNVTVESWLKCFTSASAAKAYIKEYGA